MSIDWDALWQQLSNRFVLPEETIHGPEHWQRVERYGVDVAVNSGGDLLVVRLFAVFHDACRINDSIDEAHGARAAELAAQFRGVSYELSDEHFALLQYACTWHTAGRTSSDAILGACWDADRLDLWRAGITPRATFMSTDYARKLVQTRRIGPRYVPQIR